MFNRSIKALHNLGRHQEGMTGLETAIILIAFVTVAAVFGYAVLSAGLFSAERGKETVYAGLAQAKSNLDLSGSVIAICDNWTNSENTTVSRVLFTLKNAIAGTPMDITPCDGTSTATNRIVISLLTNGSYINNVKWSQQTIGVSDGDNMLDVGEQVEITVTMSDLGDGKVLTDNLTANCPFNFQVKPSLGSTLTLQRTLPPALDPYMDLH